MTLPLTERSRGQSAKALLKIAWDYPTYKAEEKATSGTTARPMRRALSTETVFQTLAGNDPRPLLVLRECEVCNGTDDALLSTGGSNERTFLMSGWFHCVKVPVDVLQPNHPYYEVFGHDDPEHLFVALADGSMKLKLESQTSRTELWDAMGQVLSEAYKTDAQSALKLVAKSLDHMDVLDEKLLDLRSKRNELLETESAGSPKLQKIDLQIAEVEREMAATKASIAETSKLELKRPQAPTAGAGSAKAAR